MDFTTPEATNDLGGLVRDITESVVHARAPAGARQAGRALRHDLVVEADRRRRAVDCGAGVVGRRRFRRAGAGGHPHRAGPPDGRGAIPGVGRPGRGCARQVRIRCAAERLGHPGGQGREDPHRRTRRRDGSGPGPGAGRRFGLPVDGHPGTGALRSGRGRIPGARRDRVRSQGVPHRRRRSRACR